MNENLQIGLLLFAVAVIIAVGRVYWTLHKSLGDDEARLAALKDLNKKMGRDEADRHRRWVAREAMETARRLKYAGHHRHTAANKF